MYDIIQALHTLHTYYQHIIPYIHHESFHSYLQRTIWNNNRNAQIGTYGEPSKNIEK